MNTSILKQLDKLTLPIQSAILGIALIGTTIIWHVSIWKNLYSSLQVAIAKAKINSPSTAILETELETLKDTAKKIQQRQATTTKKEPQKTPTMVSHAEINSMLHDTLSRNNNMSLLQLDNLSITETPITSTGGKLFEHGIILKFTGDYFSTMNYLETLEELKWWIVWDKIDYKVTQYPMAKITLAIRNINKEAL